MLTQVLLGMLLAWQLNCEPFHFTVIAPTLFGHLQSAAT